MSTPSSPPAPSIGGSPLKNLSFFDFKGSLAGRGHNAARELWKTAVVGDTVFMLNYENEPVSVKILALERRDEYHHYGVMEVRDNRGNEGRAYVDWIKSEDQVCWLLGMQLADREGELDVEKIIVGSLVYYKFKHPGSIELDGRVVAVDGDKLTLHNNGPQSEDGNIRKLVVMSKSKVLSWEEPIPEVVTWNLKSQTSKEARDAQLSIIPGDTVVVQKDSGELVPVQVADIRRLTKAEHYGAMVVVDEGERVVCWVDNVLERKTREPRVMTSAERERMDAQMKKLYPAKKKAKKA